MTKIQRKIPTMYMVVFALYSIQGSLGNIGAALGVPLLLVIVSIGLYFMFYVNTHLKTTHFIKAVNILIVLLSLYAIYYIAFDDTVYVLKKTAEYVVVDKTSTIKNVYLSFLPLYIYYWASKKNMIDEKWLKRFFILWVFVSVVSFFQFQKSIIQYNIFNSIESEGITNNMGHEFLTLIPFLLIIPFTFRTKYLFLSLLSIMAFSSFKRGTIILLVVFLIIFIFHEIRSSSVKIKIRLFVLTVIFLMIMSYFVYNLFEESEYLQSRLESTLEGYSSGRDGIYAILLDHFTEKASFIQKLFGNGTDYTVYLCGNWAHNDWLELLTCQGILGISAFVYYFLALAQDNMRMFNKSLRVGLYMVLLMFSFLSLVSMSYPNFSTTVFIGFCLGKIKRREVKVIS